MADNHFCKIGKKYYLSDWVGVLVSVMDEVSLAFLIKGNGDVELIKYGSGSSVKAWYDEHGRDYPTKSGDKLMVFTASSWSERELNLVLSDNTYAKSLYNRLQREFNDSGG